MQIPKSVSAYVEDAGLRRAVVTLRDVGSDGLLDGLDWAELPRFYSALQAARQVETEWAIFACALWDRVWGGLLDTWRALTPDEQRAADASAGVNVASLLETSDDGLWFGRMFVSGGWTLYAAVAAVPVRGLVVKVACDAASRSTRFPTVSDRPDEIGYWTSAPAALREGGTDFETLRSVAVGAARSLPGAGRQNRTVAGGAVEPVR